MPDPTGPRRLDRAVVEAGLAPSRSRARDLIKRGYVRIDGNLATKTSATVADTAALALAHDAPNYVSRGAEKLAAALAAFSYCASGRVALDVGASTGGFTECLLAAGASRVYAVDIGTDQLHPDLRANNRVVSMEQTDARNLNANLIPDPVAAIVVDVSFISVQKALPAGLALAAPGAWMVVLIKPQFEVGRSGVGKGGIVSDPDARQAAVDSVAQWVASQPGWQVNGIVPSPITGGDGNQEFLLGARYDRP